MEDRRARSRRRLRESRRRCPQERPRQGRVGCIVLGRGEDDPKVRQWLATAAAVPGFIGFAIGRTSFWGPLLDWRAKRITRDATVAEIASRYEDFVDVFETTAETRRERAVA